MKELQIRRVANNVEKSQTYRELTADRKRAVKGGFFFEAIMIDYAMIEDRLRSILYHMGFLADRNALRIYKKTRPALQMIVERYDGSDKRPTLTVKTISGKIKLIRCVLQFMIETEDDFRNDAFLKALKRQLEGTDQDLFLKVLNEIETWKNTRNEIVHAMLNKNVVVLRNHAKEHAESGLNLARTLDNQNDRLKKGGRIRKSVSLSVN